MDHIISKNLLSIRNQKTLIITSPSGRCGTTALQRLLSSSNKTVTYSEDSTPLDYCKFMLENIGMLTKHYENLPFPVSARLPIEIWVTTQLPKKDKMVEAIFNSTYHYFNAYRGEIFDDSEVVVIKKPSLGTEQLKAFKFFFPNTKIIFIYRDIIDVLRSHLGYRIWRDRFRSTLDQATKDTLLLWLHLCEEWMKEPVENSLTINYAEISSSTEFIGKISQYSWDLSFDARVLDKKINGISNYQSPIDLPKNYNALLHEKEDTIQNIEEFFNRDVI